jgi:hypothetical protein
MKTKATILAGAVLGSMWISTAMADHNSIWGEGWANMPNDIHNTRIDTRDSDNDTFTDFVRYGNGADSVNRFDDSTTTVAAGGTTATRSMGSVRAGGKR